MEEAKIQKDALVKTRTALGEKHPDTLITMQGLAWTYQVQERNVEAAKIQEDMLEKERNTQTCSQSSTTSLGHISYRGGT